MCRKYKGKELVKTSKLKKVFGYKNGTNIRYSKMYSFIIPDVYIHPCQYWKIKNNFIAVLFEDLPNYEKEFVTSWGTINSNLNTINDDNGDTRFLIREEEVPFWKLKKYGGYIE